MNTSGDAAEQIVRLSLEGFEVAARLTGAGAKNLAILLYTVLKNKDVNKTKGRARLTSMIKSGKPLTVFGVRNEDMALFVKEAKRYGVVYCALRNPKENKDGMTDLIVRQEDASRINRIVERFNLAIVDTASIQTDIVRDKDGRVTGKVQEQKGGTQAKDEALLDDLLGKETTDKGKEASGMPKESAIPSEHSSVKQKDDVISKIDGKIEKPSVRQALHLIKESQDKQRQQEVKKPERDHKDTIKKSKKYKMKKTGGRTK